jgi:hypothetical protein
MTSLAAHGNVWSMTKGAALIWARPWGWTGAVPVPATMTGTAHSDMACSTRSPGTGMSGPRQGRALAWHRELGLAWLRTRRAAGNKRGDGALPARCLMQARGLRAYGLKAARIWFKKAAGPAAPPYLVVWQTQVGRGRCTRRLQPRRTAALSRVSFRLYGDGIPAT